MKQIKIKSYSLNESYGLKNNSIHDVIEVNEKGNIFYVLNLKHIPGMKPIISTAWAAILDTECELIS